MSEHETVDLRALGTLMRRMQGELRALGIKLDLLAAGASARRRRTRDDMRDIVDVMAERLADFDQRISGQLADFDLRVSNVVGQVAKQMESHGKMLGEILDRLPPR